MAKIQKTRVIPARKGYAVPDEPAREENYTAWRCDCCSREMANLTGTCHICDRRMCTKCSSCDPGDHSDYPSTWCIICTSLHEQYKPQFQELEAEYERRDDAIREAMKADSLANKLPKE